MKSHHQIIGKGVSSRASLFSPGLLPFVAMTLFCCAGEQSYASSGTWLLDPLNNDWNTAANWSSLTPPNGSFDVATFGSSNAADITISQGATVFSMVFNAGASSYTFTVPGGQHFTLCTDGIHNDSGVVQRLNVLPADTTDSFTSVALAFESSAASNTVFVNYGATVGGGANGGFTQFVFRANAGSAVLLNNGGAADGAKGGEVDFFNSALASTATITNKGGTVSGALGGRTIFWFVSSGEEAVVTAEGANVEGGVGGVTIFQDSSRAADATLIAEGGTNGGGGGTIQFTATAAGGTPRVEVFGNGSLDVSAIKNALTIGSLEGDGMVSLGKKQLSIGANNLSTGFSGVISGTGGVTKTGTGTLTLSGADTYTGNTTVSAGVLVANTKRASSTGTGSVNVNGGTLGGKGMISGPVTIGTGSGSGATLAPSVGSKQPVTLSLSSLLTLQGDSTYTCQLSTQKAKADAVIANGVTIASGAQFTLQTVGNKRLSPGALFTILSNTAATPISGTFANLADGSTLTAGRNTLQVSYTGGDGNDLTLTVQ